MFVTSEPVDPFEGAERLAAEAEVARVEALRSRWSRAEAVAHGAALGLETAVLRGESGQDRDQRVARARAYAAWEWDGKPAGGAHLAEFGVVRPEVHSDQRVNGTDWKGGKK